MTVTETVIYQGPGGAVSTTRAMLGGVTYPIAAIASVSMVRLPGNSFGAVLLTLGVIVTIAGAFARNETLIWGIGMLVGGWYLAFKVRPPWAIVIRTSGGETTALKSTNYEHVLALVDAINQAIVARG